MVSSFHLLIVAISVLAGSRSAEAQGCACNFSFNTGPSNYSTFATAYNQAPQAACGCGGGFAGVCQNIGSSPQSQIINSNGTTTFTVVGSCLTAPAQTPSTTLVLPSPPAASPPTVTSPPLFLPAATPLSSPLALPPTSATPPEASPPTGPPSPASPPQATPPAAATPPTSATPPAAAIPPALATPPTTARPPAPATPPVAATPPAVQPPQASPPPPANPPAGPATPGSTVINNSNNTNITNTNVTNIQNTVTNINNTVTTTVVNNINSPTTSSTPGTTTPASAPAVPPTPPTPVTSVTQGAAVPPVPVATLPPAPPTPPQCGVQPQCRLFAENNLCCQNEGILSEAQYVSVWILCTHAVQLPQTCLSIGGPANVSVSPFFTDGTVGTKFTYPISLNDTVPYVGQVLVDIEQARTVRPECTLNISPCIFNGQTVTTVQPVTELKLSIINPLTFELGYVGLPANNLETLDGFSWMDPSNSSACLEQSRINLVKPPNSFGYNPQAFVTQPGYKVPCSAQTTFSAILPNAQAETSLPSSGVAGVAP